jgi:hypothetical protein
MDIFVWLWRSLKYCPRSNSIEDNGNPPKDRASCVAPRGCELGDIVILQSSPWPFHGFVYRMCYMFVVKTRQATKDSMPGETWSFLYPFLPCALQIWKILEVCSESQIRNHCAGGRPEGERVRVAEGARRMLHTVLLWAYNICWW